MKVLQLVSSTGFYGAERMICLLSGALREIGVETTLGIFNATNPACARFTREASTMEVPVWNFRCNGRWDLQAVGRLVKFLRKNRIDVIHTHGYKANLYGLIAARSAGCSIVSTCHNWTDRTSSLRQYAKLDRFLLRRFDAVVGVSQGVASDLRRARVRDRRIRVISNGIQVQSYRQNKTSPTASSQPMILGCVSRLSSEKGVDVLLWAMPKVLSVFPDLQCFVAGEGPERQRLQGLITELGLTGSVHMPGFCEDTPAFIQRCTLMVQPSRIEAMPMAVLESMASGKVVVASAVGEIPRLLEDGNAGALVPPERPELLAEAVIAVLSDSVRRQRMEKRAAEKALEQFDVSVMASEYLHTYQAGVSKYHPANSSMQSGRVSV